MNFFKILRVAVLMIVIGLVIKLIAFPVAVVNNVLDTPREINDRVMNADNAIKSYEWFKQQEADIKRLVEQENNHKKSLTDYVSMLPKDRVKWDFNDKAEWSRLNANLTAQKDMVNKAMQDYNAKSSMVTKNIFKNNLPSNLSRSWYAQKNLIFQ